RSMAQGAAADVLSDVRRQRARLTAASEQLSRARAQLDAVDVEALSSDPRLARVARLVDVARAQAADLSDGLALTSPDRLETLLGGRGPRALVLSISDNHGQAYAVLQEGRVVDIGA